jgi:hypothetical protein
MNNKLNISSTALILHKIYHYQVILFNLQIKISKIINYKLLNLLVWIVYLYQFQNLKKLNKNLEINYLIF